MAYVKRAYAPRYQGISFNCIAHLTVRRSSCVCVCVNVMQLARGQGRNVKPTGCVANLRAQRTYHAMAWANNN